VTLDVDRAAETALNRICPYFTMFPLRFPYGILRRHATPGQRVLDDAASPDRVIFHCYSGDADMARYCSRRGWFLSFAGPVTFKNAGALRTALAATSLEQILVETDSPFLTPHPHRGRPNGSYLMPYTVKTIAEVVGHDLESVCTALENTTNRALGTW
jgi:TatD DNase family protein